MLGLSEFEAAMNKVMAEADAAAKASVVQAAAMIESKTKANFSGSHAKGQPHVGGDKPNVVSGTARRSVRSTTATRMGLGVWEIKVGPTVIYYRRLELGFNGSRGYPSFGPAVTESRGQFPSVTAEQWRAFTS